MAGPALALTVVPVRPAAECVTLQQGWARLPANPAMRMTAGYARLNNACATPATVVAASSAGFAEVSIHESVQVDGVSRMREVSPLPLPVGAQVVLAPGGLHLMLMQGHAELREGQQVPVQLQFGDGSRLDTELVVRKTAPL